MADGDLSQADFASAFAFGRGETAAWRDAGGVVQVAAADVPRFDHAADGSPRGLLVTGGVEPGGGDRPSIIPGALPAGLRDLSTPTASDATVFHRFAPLVDNDADWQPVRRAWYSRNAQATIDALLAQSGHHLEIGVVAGHRENAGGFVRYRGEEWLLVGGLSIDGAVLADDEDRPLLVAGS